MVTLENGYEIQVEDMNYTLLKKSVSKNGNEIAKRIGYYTSLESALKGYMDICISKKLEEDVYSLKDAIQMVRAERERIERLV